MPGLLHTIGDEYFRRVEAVEFTVRNDDGREPRNLPKADLVLVGISRTSKTPLSTFLAQKGLKVANVPLVLGIDPPTELFAIDQERVFGLTIKAESLLQIRQARLKHLGMPSDTSPVVGTQCRQRLRRPGSGSIAGSTSWARARREEAAACRSDLMAAWDAVLKYDLRGVASEPANSLSISTSTRRR